MRLILWAAFFIVCNVLGVEAFKAALTLPPDEAFMPGVLTVPLVGLTAFTTQAPRAYKIAEQFRSRGIPVVMGGIHASLVRDEAAQHVDSVFTGECEALWPQVLADVEQGQLIPMYEGGTTGVIGGCVEIGVWLDGSGGSGTTATGGACDDAGVGEVGLPLHQANVTMLPRTTARVTVRGVARMVETDQPAPETAGA